MDRWGRLVSACRGLRSRSKVWWRVDRNRDLALGEVNRWYDSRWLTDLLIAVLTTSLARTEVRATRERIISATTSLARTEVWATNDWIISRATDFARTEVWARDDWIISIAASRT